MVLQTFLLRCTAHVFLVDGILSITTSSLINSFYKTSRFLAIYEACECDLVLLFIVRLVCSSFRVASSSPERAEVTTSDSINPSKRCAGPTMCQDQLVCSHVMI